jgi:hypothetical protein
MERKWKPTRKWWAAYGELHGNAVKPDTAQMEMSGLVKGVSVTPIAKPKKVKKAVPTEQHEQFVVVAWLRKMNVLVHHSPNGGYRNPIEAAKFKRLGVSAGFPDLFLPYARKGRYGLYIELKRVSGGRLSEYQEFWRDHLLKEGYAWFEAKGAEEAINIVKDYLQWT